jgi:hypothetical protein
VILMSIDPGLKGALLKWVDGVPIEVIAMPLADKEYDLQAIAAFVHSSDAIIIEDVGGIRGQGASAAFNFGMGVGKLHGLAFALGIPLYKVRPMAWQANFEAGLPKKMQPKIRSISAAQRWYPQFRLMFVTSRTPQDAISDALGIGKYYFDVIKGEKNGKS